MLIEYVLSAILLGVVVAIPPGSVTVIALQRVLRYGFKNGLYFTIGSACTDIFYLLIVYFGVAQIIATNSIFKFILFLICGCILLYLSISSLISMHRSKNGSKANITFDEKAGATVLSGMVITLANPMTIVGWLAVGGNFFLLWGTKGELFSEMGPAIIIFIMIGALIWFIPLLMVIAKIRHMMNQRVVDILIVGGNIILFCFGLLSFYNAFLIIRV